MGIEELGYSRSCVGMRKGVRFVDSLLVNLVAFTLLQVYQL